MALFQRTSVPVSGRLLKLLKDEKLSSSMISQGSVHLSKPIWVEMALRDLESFKGNID